MLRKEQNDLLTQTGPGTPMGGMFRSYWLPALLAEELPEPGCPPVRVKLLSERLLAFRDSEGQLGLIDEFCAHRGVSLWFARNEEAGDGSACGLRCPYHGWKYDRRGSIAWTYRPSRSESGMSASRIKLKNLSAGGTRRHPLDLYGCRPEHLQPPLPEWEFIDRAGANRSFTLQAVAGMQLAAGAWKAGSIRAMCPGCISGGLNTDPLCSRARRVTNIT